MEPKASWCLKPCIECTGKKSGLGISIVNFSELGDICPQDFVIPSRDVQMLLLLENNPDGLNCLGCLEYFFILSVFV